MVRRPSVALALVESALLVSVLALLVSFVAAGACEGRCGTQSVFGNAASCWCEPACDLEGDCCNDFSDDCEDYWDTVRLGSSRNGYYNTYPLELSNPLRVPSDSENSLIQRWVMTRDSGGSVVQDFSSPCDAIRRARLTLDVEISNYNGNSEYVSVTVHGQQLASCNPDEQEMCDQYHRCDYDLSSFLSGVTSDDVEVRLQPTESVFRYFNRACVPEFLAIATMEVSCYAYCDIGEYANDNNVCVLCPAGLFGDQLGLLSAACSGECEEGYYCTAGSTSRRQAPCPAGTYCPAKGTRFVSEATTCAAGYYCPEASAAQIECPEGSYCAAGVGEPTLCPVGHYCESRVGAPTECAAGRFGAVEGLSDTSCSGECPEGTFSSEGATACTPCPVGQWHAERGQTSQDACVDHGFVPSTVRFENGGRGSDSLLLASTDGTAVIQIDFATALALDFGSAIMKYGTADSLDYTCDSLSQATAGGDTVTFTCSIGEGVGADLRLALEFEVGGERYVTLSDDTLSYPPPSVEECSLRFPDGVVPGSCPGTVNNLIARTTLDAELWLDVSNLGAEPEKISLSYGSDGTDFVCSDFAVVSPGVLSFRTEAYADGTNLRFLLTVGGQVAPLSSDTYTYESIPFISSISGCPDSTISSPGTNQCPTEGGVTITISGGNLVSGMIFTVAGNPCGSAKVANTNDSATCMLPPGAGFNQVVVGRFEELVSAPVTFVSYAAPLISAIKSEHCSRASDESPIKLEDCPRKSQPSFTIHGSSFGESGASVLVGGENVACTHVPPLVHEELSCQLPQMSGLERFVLVVQNGGGISVNSPSISFEQCAPGTHADGLECPPCEVGFFSAVPGQAECTPCEAGRFTNETGMSSCHSCAPGYAQDEIGQSSCNPCAEGTFASALGFVDCSPCPAGRWASGTATTECVDCEVGTFSQPINDTHGATQCTDCDAGRYASRRRSAECLPCHGGNYQNETGQSGCILCDAGTFSLEQLADGPGTIECSTCPNGTASAEGSTLCEICLKGHFSSLDRSVCEECPAGQFQNASQQTECKPCPPGTVTEGTGRDSCSRCSAGSFQAEAGMTECESCGAGRVANDDRTACMPCAPGVTDCEQCTPGRSLDNVSGKCTPCMPGYYQNLANQPSCKPCPPGLFQDDEYQTQCKNCPGGMYSNESASTMCVECPAGTYRPHVSDSPTCLPCPEGQYQNLLGQSECKLCDPGTYMNGTNAIACIDCPVGFAAPEEGHIVCDACTGQSFQRESGQRSCDVCDDDLYLARDESGEESCRPCPEGAKCEAGAPAVLSEEGFWLTTSDTGHITSFRCLPKACPQHEEMGSSCELSGGGGDLGDNGPLQQQESSVSVAVSCCGENRVQSATNYLCAQCEDGYYEWANECIECTNTNALFVSVIFFMWVWIVMFRIICQASGSLSLVLFYFLQMVLLFLPNTDWLQWINLFGFSIFVSTTPICLAELTPMLKLLMGIIIPVGSVFLLLATYGIHKLLLKVKRYFYPRSKTLDVDVDTYIRTLIGLYLFSFSNITLSVFKFLDCQAVTDDVSVVSTAPAIICNQGEWSLYLPLIVMLLAGFVILSPMIMLGWLIKRRKVLEDTKNATRYGLIYEMFKPKYYWYNYVVLARRSIVIGVFVALNSNVQHRYLGVGVVNLAVLLLHIATTPFTSLLVNTCETVSLAVLTFLSLMLIIAEQPLNFDYSISLGLLIFLPLLAYVCIMIVQVVRFLHKNGWLGSRIVREGEKYDEDVDKEIPRTELQRMSRQYYSSRTFSGLTQDTVDYISSGALALDSNGNTRRNSITSQASSITSQQHHHYARSVSMGSGVGAVAGRHPPGPGAFHPGHHHSMSMGSLGSLPNGVGYKNVSTPTHHGHSASVVPVTAAAAIMRNSDSGDTRNSSMNGSFSMSAGVQQRQHRRSLSQSQRSPPVAVSHSQRSPPVASRESLTQGLAHSTRSPSVDSDAAARGSYSAPRRRMFSPLASSSVSGLARTSAATSLSSSPKLRSIQSQRTPRRAPRRGTSLSQLDFFDRDDAGTDDDDAGVRSMPVSPRNRAGTPILTTPLPDVDETAPSPSPSSGSPHESAVHQPAPGSPSSATSDSFSTSSSSLDLTTRSSTGGGGLPSLASTAPESVAGELKSASGKHESVADDKLESITTEPESDGGLLDSIDSAASSVNPTGV